MFGNGFKRLLTFQLTYYLSTATAYDWDEGLHS